ncbi:MAG TPA: N-acetyltransferase [Candidatus Acidoferrales bacterium]
MEGLIRVRRMMAADLPHVLAIQGASREASQWSGESYRAFLSEEAEPATPAAPVESVGWVAGVGAGLQTAPFQAPVGFLAARFLPGECEILNLAVSTAARRRGAGSALVRQALETALAWGAKTVWLEVRESNTAAIAFYMRQGFVPAGTRPGYYQSPPEAAVILRRGLEGGL